MSLQKILNEERNYWIGVKKTTNNRLLKRTAEKNIQKRLTQMHKLKIAKKNS